MRECSFEACEMPSRSLGLCEGHYGQLRRGVELTKLKHQLTLEDRFWSKVDKSGDCWFWLAYTDQKGYGKFGLGGRRGGMDYAHRVSYRIRFGEIPEGMHVDHLCYQKSCVRPDHLRAVPRAWNQQNMSGPPVTSRTGVRGVRLDPKYGNYRCSGQVDGKTKYLGTFASIGEASDFMEAWRRENYPGCSL